MHWHTHALHEEYSRDHFDNYKLTFVPDQGLPEQPEGMGLWPAFGIALVLALIVGVILLVTVL